MATIICDNYSFICYGEDGLNKFLLDTDSIKCKCGQEIAEILIGLKGKGLDIEVKYNCKKESECNNQSKEVIKLIKTNF